MKTSG